MSVSVSKMNAPDEFKNLFREGKEAARLGNPTQAHALFRQAIEVDPYHEQIWLWLASVVDTDDDRRVCFENVLELNPANPTARRQLQLLDHKILDETKKPSHNKRNTSLRRVAFTVGLLVMIAVLITLVVGLF